MINEKVITIKRNNVEQKESGTEYKVVEVNISDPAESLYAICTPIKMQ